MKRPENVRFVDFYERLEISETEGASEELRDALTAVGCVRWYQIDRHPVEELAKLIDGFFPGQGATLAAEARRFLEESFTKFSPEVVQAERNRVTEGTDWIDRRDDW